MAAEAVAQAGGHGGEAGQVAAHLHGAVAEAGLEALQHGGVRGDGGRQVLPLHGLKMLHRQF